MRKNTRIYYPDRILESSEIVLEKKQSHYIKNVMRLKEGNLLSIFNQISISDFYSLDTGE